MLIELLIARYHQLNHIQSGYDFHSQLINQKWLVTGAFHLIKTILLLRRKKISKIVNADFSFALAVICTAVKGLNKYISVKITHQVLLCIFLL